MMREEAPGKLFKFNKQSRFFLSYSLMIKYRVFRRNCKMIPPLQVSLEEYVEENMLPFLCLHSKLEKTSVVQRNSLKNLIYT